MKLRGKNCQYQIRYKTIPSGKQICNNKVWDVGWEKVGVSLLYTRIRTLMDREIYETQIAIAKN